MTLPSPTVASQRERIARLKRRVYVSIVAAGLVATILGLLIISSLGAVLPIVRIAFLAAIVSDLVVIWGVYAGKISLRVIEELIYLTGGGLLVVLLLSGLYLTEDPLQSRITLSGSYLWMPVIYTVIFLTQDTRGALLRSVPLYALVLCVSLPIAFGLFDADATSFRTAFSLVQLYLSSAVIIATLFLFCRIKDWVSEAEGLIGRMKRLSETDELTGLHNRRRAARILEEEMERSRLHGVPLSVIVLDIDDFKNVNDELGHDAGDEVLREVARLGGRALRENDEFGRWGGEEFIVIVPETKREPAHLLAERLRNNIEDHDFGVGRRISASFGVSEFHPRDSKTTLVKRADAALYRAKVGGKNRVEAESPIT